MEETPQISVVMGVYNEEENVPTALQSILDQTLGDFEFIVVDDCSSDDTKNIIQKFADKRVHLLENERNRGLTESLNRGIEAAEGEYIARMDADDFSRPTRLEKQVSVLDSEDVQAVACWYQIRDEEGKLVSTCRFKSDRSFGFHDLVNEQRAVAHGSVMIRRNAIEAIGGYDQRFTLSQDRDLWFRLAAEFGPKFMDIVDECLYEYSISPTAFAKRPRQNFYGSYATMRAATERVTGERPPHKFSREFLRDCVDSSRYSLSEDVTEGRYWEMVGESSIDRGDTLRGYQQLFRSITKDPKDVRSWFRLIQPFLTKLP